MIETLENRLLCRVSHVRPVFFVDDARTLRVSGTAGNDSLLVGGKSGEVTLILNGRTSVVEKKVRRAVIYGGGGDDLIDCGKGGEFGVSSEFGISSEVDETRFPAFVDGGAGNDTIYAGGVGDSVTGNTLLGGGGNDLLATTQYGLGPRVYMDGGPGDDELKYGSILHGGSGDDIATVDTFYGGPVFNSGLEKYTDLNRLGYGSLDLPRDDYPSDLTVRHGRLEFSYLLDGYYERNVIGPYLRPDGRIGVTVTRDEPRDGVPERPKRRQSLTLSDRYTARALQKGLVLSFVGSAISGPSQDWVIWSPASG